MTRVDLRIKTLPMSLNQWTTRHWRSRHEQTQKWKLAVLHALGMDRRRLIYLHGPLLKGPVHVAVHFCIAGKRRMDLDNLVPKAILDAMKGQVFEDDNDSVVRSLTLTSERITEGTSFTEVSVWEFE